MEFGLRLAVARLENRQRRFGVRLLSLPQGNQAGEVVGAAAGICLGRRLECAFGYSGGTATTVLLEKSKELNADIPQQEGAKAKKGAECTRPRLTMEQHYECNWTLPIAKDLSAFGALLLMNIRLTLLPPYPLATPYTSPHSTCYSVH
jgi:hypothetical protein